MSVVNMLKALENVDILQCARISFCASLVRFKLRPTKGLAFTAIIILAQFATSPSLADGWDERKVPSAKRLPQAMKVVEQTTGNVSKTLSGMVRIMFRTPDGTKWQGPDQGTFYDRKGRLRKWVRDPSVPGGIRALESPPMEELRNITRGWVDWGFESDYVGTDFNDLPLISPKSVLDQSYQERKHAKMRFVTKMGLTLSMPSPMVIDKKQFAMVRIKGNSPYPIKVRYWVDGEEKFLKYSIAGGSQPVGFTLPMTLATSGRHSLKVETVDADGKARSRFINFPVSFKFTADSKTSSRDGGRTKVRIRIKGSDGPFKATFVTNDGQRVEENVARDEDTIYQIIPNPGMDTVKWIDVVLEDTRVGYVVSKRIKLDDVPVEARLTSDKTELAPDEKVTLSVVIEGGEPSFKLLLYVNGKRKKEPIGAKDRKGTFLISFDEPGTYNVYVDVLSKNIAGENISSPTKTIVLNVAGPEEEVSQGLRNSYSGWLTLGGSAVSEYQYSFKHSTFSFTIEDTKVSGSTSGVLYSPLSEGTTDNFRGVISGTYDPETQKISASLKINWSSGDIDFSGIDREGVAIGEMVSGGFRGTWTAGLGFQGAWTASGYSE